VVGRAPESSRDSEPGSGAQVVTLQLGAAETIGDLTLRWLDVNDSRCPQGVTCVWEGEVTITLEVASGGNGVETLDLKMRPGTETAASDAAAHRFRLLSVEPVPVHGEVRAEEDLVAEIEVDRV